MLYSPVKIKRPGTVVPIVAFFLVAMIGMLSLAIDIGVLILAREQCQNAADIGALAGARTLDGSPNNNVTTALQQAQIAATANSVLNQVISPTQVSGIHAGVYRYNTLNQRFEADFVNPPQANESWGAMQISVSSSSSTFFGSLFGVSSVQVNATAAAVHRPRDIAIILDFSGSMSYASQPSYNDGFSLVNLLPDSRFPQFGPWSIFAGNGMVLNYQNPGSPPADLTNYVPPTPFQRVFPYVSLVGETYGPSNLTTDMPQGPALVNSFVLNDYATPAFVYSGSFPNFTNVNVSTSNNPTYVVTPAPASFTNPFSGNYAGDLFPLRSGIQVNGNNAPTPDQYAQTVADYLGMPRNNVTNMTYNSTFETNGYDWDFTKNQLKPAAQRFQGFSMGPGYFGKTFYMWPPDPRTPVGNIGDSNYVAGDWRVRFFLPRQGSGMSTQDNSMFWNSAGRWNAQYPGPNANYVVNYNAILQWLSSGPQTLPANLQAGRVVYYSSIPTSIPVDPNTGILQSAASTDVNFWKDYIDYVLGTGRWTDSNVMFGANSSNTNTATGSPLAYNNPSSTNLQPQITPQSFLAGNPPPYMNYIDSPVHPLGQFWFGPISMLSYLHATVNWFPGTAYEAPSWQLKVGVNAALQDIQLNHPNDLASMIYFSSSDVYSTARVSLSRQFPLMQNALFYPYPTLSNLGDLQNSILPYTTTSPVAGNPSGIVSIGEGIIPNGGSETCPQMAFMVAMNQLSSARDTSINTVYNGRNGANKIVIFETDGVPNAICQGNLSSSSPGTSGNWYYGNIGSTSWYGFSQNLHVPPKDNARAIVRQIVAQQTASPPGYSTTRTLAYVHAIGFGDIFEPTNPATMRTPALQFLTAVQIDGNTTQPPSGNWDNNTLNPNLMLNTEPYKIITGNSSTRINNLQQAFQRIMEGGIQVSLIQ